MSLRERRPDYPIRWLGKSTASTAVANLFQPLATKTALEINSQPDRLDMRDAHARLAGEAGVLITIDSDAHSKNALGYVEYGVSVARRAWLTKEQILNTRPWREIEKMRA